ncbi:MAG TPA: thiolase family protein [Gemmatimonadota bacterium]|nr:thiolase family protein [Gemmatimonadota bacterium]
MNPRYPRPVYLCAPVRTPIGRFGGALVDMTAPDLGTHAARAALDRAGIDPADIDLTIVGCGRQAGAGPNVARQISHRAGVPDSVPAYTINQACASSLVGIVQAWQTIALGDAEVVLAAGTESMSNTPYLLPRARWGYRLGHGELVDGMYRDGFLCPLCGDLMGATAETLADRYGIPRAEQDAYAAESQRRYDAARERGAWESEIAPIEGVLEADEHPRPGTTVEKLAKLKPVFRDDGTVHAGNSSGITDGAAALIVASEEAVARLGLEPFARCVDWANEGVDPAIMGIGPVPAVRKILERQDVGIDAIDAIELNEAFAAQVLAVARDLDLDLDRVNPNGGAIALGHPIGATGARIAVTLLHEMARRRAGLGLATLCVSGGMGVAVLVERVESAAAARVAGRNAA